MRISDWSSDVCSSDLPSDRQSTTCTAAGTPGVQSMPCDNSLADGRGATLRAFAGTLARGDRARVAAYVLRSEEHTSELQSLMRISYAVFCLKKKIKTRKHHIRPV